MVIALYDHVLVFRSFHMCCWLTYCDLEAPCGVKEWCHWFRWWLVPCSTPTQIHEPNADSFTIGPCGTNFSEIGVNIIKFSSVCLKNKDPFINFFAWDFLALYIGKSKQKISLYYVCMLMVTYQMPSVKHTLRGHRELVLILFDIILSFITAIRLIKNTF